eukprot:CAMPEP_0172688628 /NCGR_PEP_ID=MMETSP1074-20121228/22546_1 /TAXON_ID=2916 /ORGANISM="Ceratium fusus, Strain PA161109" /LENGTH=95 /DNA_ID=CAMNT_0013508303 /DNA_START=405 /DNA_END=693 /DNA_ORIENTATION=+
MLFAVAAVLAAKACVLVAFGVRATGWTSFSAGSFKTSALRFTGLLRADVPGDASKCAVPAAAYVLRFGAALTGRPGCHGDAAQRSNASFKTLGSK